MQYALLIIDAPALGSSNDTVLYNFARQAEQSLGKSSSVETVNAGCFVLPLDSGLNDLATLVALAKDRGYAHRTLFFDKGIPFVKTDI
jgi:hypothetical protein